MMSMRSAIVAVAVAVVVACARGDDSAGVVRGLGDGDLTGTGARLLTKIYEDCQRRGLVPCLKIKAITFFDRASRSREISLGETITVQRNGAAPAPPREALSERELEASLPRGSEEARDARLNAILFNRIADFFNSHRLVVSLPKMDPAEIQRGVEEGRGKMKKMMSMMMMGFAMKMAAAVPMAVGLLFLLAGKALIISKIALVLTLIIALKKLIAQKQSHHEVTWHTGGGWDRRSYLVPHPAAQDLAYRGHLVNTFTGRSTLGKQQ